MSSGLSKRRFSAFTLVELLVIVSTVVMLAILLLPALGKTRPRTGRIACVNNLKQVGLAFRLFGTDHEGRFPMRVSTHQGGSMEYLNEGITSRHFLTLSDRLGKSSLLYCPMDKQRKPAGSFSSLRGSNVSYFVGLEASEMQPQTFLTGDRNLTTSGQPVKPGICMLTTNIMVGWAATMHINRGFVGMADGSVQAFNAKSLAEALRGSGMATNRLAVP